MDDEAFLDDEIYDDDSPDHHPVDDDDLGVLGGLARPPDPSVDAPDLQPASCFTPEYLAALAGTDNLEACTFLEMRADTTDEDLSGVGRLMPALSQLRLSNSVLPEMRAFGSAFQRLTVLWIARSEVEDLAGVASLVDLRELYAAFNEVSDVAPLAELDHLRVIDLEGNCVEDPDAPDYLGMCPRLSSLSLEGNPLSRRTYYRRIVCRAIPRLRVLDDRDVDDAIDRMEIPDGLEDEEGPEPNADDANGAMYADDPDPVASAAAAFRSLDTSAELAMVTEGIKYAAVGIDDPDAVLTRDEVTGELSVELSDAPLGGDFFSGGEQRCGDGFPGSKPGSGYPPPRPGSSRPGSSRPGSSRPGSSRPGSRPGSGGSAGGARPPTASLVRANSLGAALRGALGNAGSSRPGTAVASLSRPGTAASSRSGSGSRPGTAASWGARAASRPSTASRPSSRERPGTARSAGSRPGTASAEGWASAGFGGGEDTSSLFWRKNKQKETRAGLADRGDVAEGGGRADEGASALTTGEGMLVGNPAKLLSRRRRGNEEERRGGVGVKGGKGDGNGDGDGEATDEDIIAALRRWKIETAETMSRFDDDEADEDARRDETRDETQNVVPQPPKWTPQPPPGIPPQRPPGMRPQPPGEGGGPRRPNGRVATGGRAARAAAAAAAKSTGPETGVILSRQNPKPRAASETSGGGVDRLVLEG